MVSKICKKCSLLKALSEFASHRTECKACQKIYNANYRKEHSEILTAKDRQRYEKDSEYHKQKARAYYLKNKDKVKQQTRKYQQKHPDRVIIYAHKYYEGKRGLRADLTEIQWQTIKLIFKGKCAYCGKKSKRLEKEHVIPVSKGGCLTLRNIVPACRACNSKKSINFPAIPVKILLF